ncbi:hypothetical protein N2152v2_001832 [Parachlorella kessleri]
MASLEPQEKTLGVPHQPRPPFVRPTLLVSVAFTALYTLYTVFSHSTQGSALSLAAATSATSGRQRSRYLEAPGSGGGTLRGSGRGFSIPRASAIVQLEQRLDGDPMLGVCYQQAPLLEGVAEGACADLRCLWSEAEQENVDLWLYPLRPLPEEAVASRCPEPRGGQGPVAAGQDPVVSFVVTMHNNGLVTAQCMLELFRTAREVSSAEYVLVNDGSTEDVAMAVQAMRRLQQLFGVRFVYRVNEAAEGYGPANTQGVGAASGEFIVLVNNDLLVAKGWLSAIMHTFSQRPATGIVGPLFLGDTGLVQEAGGLVFDDAQAANHGRGKALTHRMYYLRQVDYISAACVAFRKALFQRLGGFDSQYERGYFEDTDLAMSVRAAGLQVLLQPLAVVHHLEGTTFGTDATSALKRQLMEDNRAKFVHKWGSVLQARHCPAAEGHLPANLRFTSPRLLWLTDTVPDPGSDVGSLRALHILRMLLAEGYHATVLPTTAQRDPAPKARARALGVDVVTPVTKPDKWRLTQRGRCLFDAVWVASGAAFQVGWEELSRQCPGVPLVYDMGDLQFLHEAQAAILKSGRAARQGKGADLGSPWELNTASTTQVLHWLNSSHPGAASLRAARDQQLGVVDNVTMVVAMSEGDAEVLRRYRPGAKVLVLPRIQEIPVAGRPACEGREGLLVAGSLEEAANRQAVEVLVRDVLPSVLDLIPEDLEPGFKLHVAGGSRVPDGLAALLQQNKEAVTVHGHLTEEQLRMLYHRVKVAVVPLLSGSGMAAQVRQAMHFGVPIVATPLAVRGLRVRDTEDALLATDASTFAARVVDAYTDCRFWRRLADGGLRSARQQFGVEATRLALLEVLDCVGAGPLHSSMRGICHPGAGGKPAKAVKESEQRRTEL